MAGDQYKVKDFIKDFRSRLGDSSQSVPVSYIISYLNTALRRLARQEGLEKLFEHKDTFELSSINQDGTLAASWDLGKIGTIIDIPKLRMIKSTPTGPCRITPKFMESDQFDDCRPIPEAAPAGDPDYYTIEQIGTINRLIFNRPPKNLIALDMKYSASHPRITSEDDDLQVPYSYMDLFEEYVLILHKIETTDMATGRALYEDLDTAATEVVEQLARRKSGLPYRRVMRSF